MYMYRFHLETDNIRLTELKDKIRIINEPIPKLKIASLNPVFRVINQVSNHENNPKILDD